MARVDVDQHEILEAVISELRTDLELDDRTCYEVIDASQAPLHPMATEDNWFLQVGIGPGTFDDQVLTGAVREQCLEYFQIVVGLFSRIHLDEPGHATEALIQANRGILRLKKLVLDSLAGEDLQVGTDEFGRQLWFPVYAGQPITVGVPENADVNQGLEFIHMLMGFQIGFDWDLT